MARGVLGTSGLDHRWWAEATQYYTYARNIVDKVSGSVQPAGDDAEAAGHPAGQSTPYELRHEESFSGHLIPFGCLVSYRPTSKRETSEMNKFSDRVRDGIFMGWHAHSGGKWSGDYLVMDVERYVNSESVYDIAVHRVKEIQEPKKITFPIKTGAIRRHVSAEESAPRIEIAPKDSASNLIEPTEDNISQLPDGGAGKPDLSGGAERPVS